MTLGEFMKLLRRERKLIQNDEGVLGGRWKRMFRRTSSRRVVKRLGGQDDKMTKMMMGGGE